MSTARRFIAPVSNSGSAVTPSSSDRGRRRRRDDAVVQAEIRSLARALAPYGVLRRDALERSAGARRWHDGGFDDAIAAALRAGAVKRLPFGYYRDANRNERPPPPRDD
jgi:hypothetical protein